MGENGAFTFFMQDGVRKRIDTPAGQDKLGGMDKALLSAKLSELAQKIRLRFPDARWASDQHYREYDLAIDICEDVQPWPRKRVDDLLEFCRSAGAHAKLSSIHVNAWFGDYDKRKGFENWLSTPTFDEWIFVGDSPNDEPLFGAFRYSAGVANLKKYLDRLTVFPTWITGKESGAGFTEVVEKLIESSVM